MGTEVVRAMLTVPEFPGGIKHLALVAPYNYYERFDESVHSNAISAKVGATTVYAFHDRLGSRLRQMDSRVAARQATDSSEA